MVRPYLPLNALRAFEAASRHLRFTRAAIELCVTQAAVSHQVKLLEQRLGVTLFRRLPRGLMITEEGLALLPVLRESFDRMADMLERFEGGQLREVLKIGAVGTLAVGWLLPRLADFRTRFPYIDLRLSTNNNRVDIAAEGLDYTIRFGNGAWHDIEAEALFEAPLSVLCIPPVARQLKTPEDVAGQTLLRSYRSDEWPSWFEEAGLSPRFIHRCNSFTVMSLLVRRGIGVSLLPPELFTEDLAAGSLKILIEHPRTRDMDYMAAYLRATDNALVPQLAALAREESWFLGTPWRLPSASAPLSKPM